MNNYFNYFTEIEEHFIRKRGKNLLVSPLDWCLIELWRDNGIPLHVVLRGIDRSFESAERARKRPPRTLFYCHPAIMEAFEEYSRAMLGASNPDTEAEALPGGVCKESVLEHLGRLEARLEPHSGESFARAAQRLAALKSEVSVRQRLDYRELDRDLGQISTLLARSLREEMGADKVRALRRKVKEETRVYRKRLSKEMYQRLENNYLDRRIRGIYELPEFSLLAREE